MMCARRGDRQTTTDLSPAHCQAAGHLNNATTLTRTALRQPMTLGQQPADAQGSALLGGGEHQFLSRRRSARATFGRPPAIGQCSAWRAPPNFRKEYFAKSNVSNVWKLSANFEHWIGRVAFLCVRHVPCSTPRSLKEKGPSNLITDHVSDTHISLGCVSSRCTVWRRDAQAGCPPARAARRRPTSPARWPRRVSSRGRGPRSEGLGAASTTHPV